MTKATDKIDTLLSHKRRQDTIAHSLRFATDARVGILTALDFLADINASESAAAGALRGALPELVRARLALRRMHGNCTRAIKRTCVAPPQRSGKRRSRSTRRRGADS